MPILKVMSIKCHEQEDLTGDDDAYIVINGRKFWGPKSMDTGQTRKINRVYEFNHKAVIKLYEEDWDPDDFLGQHTVTRQDAGEQELRFAEDGADYSIWVNVIVGI